MGVVTARRFDVYLVRLDPTEGHEIQKTRPCLIVSPDEMNRSLATVIVAPMTTRGHAYPSRISVEFDGRQGWIVLDQLRTVDQARLIRLLGHLDPETADRVLLALGEMFAP